MSNITDDINDSQPVFYFITYFLLLLQPFVVLNSISDVGKKLKKIIPKRRQGTVVPAIPPNVMRNYINLPVT